MFSRNDNSLIAKWWWSVDKVSLLILFIIMAIGVFLNFSVSPAVAARVGKAPYAYLIKQMVFLPAAISLMLFISFQSERAVRRWALVVFTLFFVMTIMTLSMGTETVKGAKRWLYLCGLSIQPSEFLKPSFCVLSAYVLSEGRKLFQSSNNIFKRNSGIILSGTILAFVSAVLLMQPDIGMTFTMFVIWGTQVFLAGISWLLIAALAVAGIALVVALYFTVPHFQFRIDSFFDSSVGDKYQITQALSAFHSGGIFGIGPGEGKVKAHIPDAHTDFIMAVAGEEFGFVFCLFIIVLFAFIVLRGFSLALKENKLFCMLAVTGLLVQFGFQAIVNMSSSLNIIPTKGMTLPFVSYGGSSLISIALGMGFVLALTKRQNLNGE